MVSATQVVQDSKFIENEYSEKSAISALYNELSKGIESMKKGDVYTVEEAWKEIDKI